jgi:hypothetical protein
MPERVFVVGAEYGAHPRELAPERRTRAFLAEYFDYPRSGPSFERLFFRHPRARAEWARLGALEPVGLVDLLASAGHRALCTLAQRCAMSYEAVCASIDALIVTTMPGLDPGERVNVGVLPQRVRGLLGLPARCRCQLLVGTSDAGAWAFSEAVRLARADPTVRRMLVVAGQTIPSGYASQYQIRSVLGERDQGAGFDMLGAGDLWMDVIARNYAVSRDRIEALLARVAAQKQADARCYPAAIRAGFAGHALPRTRRVTPWFDEEDVAPPACGAAAVVLETGAASQLGSLGSRDPRLSGAAALEVVGVGDGSSNPDFLDRRSPLVWTAAVRQALAAAADDAGLDTNAFVRAAFGVTHDAFPSIELAFLLSMGLSFDEAAARMEGGWSNAAGGLLTFGHAIGASGLVQIAKAFHAATGDRRYVRQDPSRAWTSGATPAGTTIFATSVGGPLSHTVVVLMQTLGAPGSAALGGGRVRSVRPAARDDGEALARFSRERREHREAMAVLGARLESFALATEQGARLALIEGTTRVSARSALRSLREEDIEGLSLDDAVALVLTEHRHDAREDLRETLRAARTLLAGDAPIFDVLDTYHDALADHVRRWRASMWLRKELSGESDVALLDRLKATVNVPLCVLLEPISHGAGTRRTVWPLPLIGEDGARFEAADLAGHDALVLRGARVVRVLSPSESAAYLPPWHAHATSPAAARGSDRPFAVSASGLGPTDTIAGACVLALGSGAATDDRGADAHAFVRLARAADRASGWLAPFACEVRYTRVGGVPAIVVEAVAPAAGDGGGARLLVSSLVRFAQSAALGLLDDALAVAITLAPALRFEAALGEGRIASDADERAIELLLRSGAPGSVAIAGADEAVAADLQRLTPRDSSAPLRLRVL